MNMGITEVNAIFITINILISYQDFCVNIFIQILSPICNLKYKIHVMLVCGLGSEEMHYNFSINSWSRLSDCMELFGHV